MVSDPIGDFINRLKNGSAIHKESVLAPYSKTKEAVALTLKKEGFISFVNTKSGKSAKKSLEVGLLYDSSGQPKISGVKRLSKPGRRFYQGASDIKPVKFGKGMSLLSTPKGIISGKEAKKINVGGEVLLEIW